MKLLLPTGEPGQMARAGLDGHLVQFDVWAAQLQLWILSKELAASGMSFKPDSWLVMANRHAVRQFELKYNNLDIPTLSTTCGRDAVPMPVVP